MLLMYIVGVMVRRDLFLPAAAMACLVAMILHIKLELHALADKFTSSELSSVMQFLLIALVILPLMPNRSFGPNDALNLHNIWLMVVFIVGISLTGYILQKLTGKRSGVISGGVIGGLISSTATTFSYSRLSSEERSSGTYHALVILIAWLVVYFRAYLEIQVVAPNIPILWPLVLMVSVSFVMVFFIWKKNIFHKEDTDITNRPIDLKTAIFFAFFYALLIAVFSYFKDDIGRTALSGVTFVAGILDIDAITLSTARLVDRKILNADQAVSYVFLALFSNTLFKGVMCLFLGKKILFDLILMPWIVSLMLQLMIIVWYW